MEKELIIKWFESIQKFATDRRNANGFILTPEDTLNEIKIFTKNCIEYLKNQ